ncbi:MAG: ABC transporter permease [Candidatus Berkelbacteria bacterium]|nr:ABC transporter permease [Candidatus Berkelbacteria bacterium]
MKFYDIIALSWKNLMANKMRSLLTITGISVGIATIVFLVSLGYGLQALSIRKITAISSLTTLDVTPAQDSIEITDSVLKDFAKIDKVEKVSPLLSFAGQVTDADKKTDVVAYVVDKDYLGLQGSKTEFGGLFTKDDQIVLSSGVAKALSLEAQDLVSNKITFTGYTADKDGTLIKNEGEYTVAGIIDDTSSAFAYVPISSNFVTASTAYNSVKVKVTDTNALASVKEAVQSKGFKASSIADTISQVYQIFSIIQIVLASFGIIALFVAAIGMFNTMTIALLERTRDIGIMKAIGVRNSTVRAIFLTESFMISFLGGFCGALSGILFAQFINWVINILAKSVGGQAEKLFYTPMPIVLAIVVFSLVVGVITGFYPAKRASKLNPLEALRYE